MLLWYSTFFNFFKTNVNSNVKKIKTDTLINITADDCKLSQLTVLKQVISFCNAISATIHRFKMNY